jgi:hypothetical protein
MVGRNRMMDLKQWSVLIAGVTGLFLVVMCPRWFYPAHPLMPQEKRIGYRFITQPPKLRPVVKEIAREKHIYSNQGVAGRVDRVDLSARIGLIIAITVCGLWILRARKVNKLHRNKR